MSINLKPGPVTTLLLLVSLVSAVYFLRSPNNPTSSHTSFTSLAPKNASLSQVYEVCGNINVREDFSEEEITQAKGINNFLSQLRGGNPILRFAFTSQTSEEFAREYAIQIAPYGLFGGVMLLFGLTTLCCLCCDYKCFRGCVKPKSSSRVGCVIFSLLFSLLMLGGAVSGWYFAKNLPYDFKRTSCAGANFIGDFSTGNQDLKWLGLVQAITDFTYVKENIEETIQLLPDVDSVHQKLNNLHDELGVEIQSLYDNNKDKTVRSPVETDPPVQPEVFQKLGPVTDEDSICGAIKQEVDTKNTYISQGLDDASSAIKTLKDQSSTITDVIQEGIDMSVKLNNNVTSILHDYIAVTKQGENWNDNIGTGIVYFFGVSAFLSFLVSLGIINTFTLKSDLGLKLMKVSRNCLNIFLLIIFTASIAIFPALIFAMEGCNTTQVAFKNETILGNIVGKLVPSFATSNVSTYIHTCLFDSGDILADFGVDEQLQKINEIFNQIQNFSDFFNTSLPDSFVLPIVYSNIESFLYGQLPVSEKVGEYLVSLNSFTNRNYSTDKYGCSESEDSWLLNSTACNSTYGLLFQSTDAPDFNYGPATCMSMNQYSSYQPTQRYGDKYSACPAQQGVPYSSVVMGLVGGFQNHMADVKTVFDQTIQDLDKVKDTNHEFMQEAFSLVDPLVEIDQRAYALLKFVGNNQTGLVSNLNCKFLKANGVLAIEQLCIAYLPDLFMICICILAFGVLALAAIIPVFCLEKVFDIERRKKEERKLEARIEREERLLANLLP